jgi:hypothetical protein
MNTKIFYPWYPPLGFKLMGKSATSPDSLVLNVELFFLQPKHPVSLKVAFGRGLAGWFRRLGAEGLYFVRCHLKSGVSE